MPGTVSQRNPSAERPTIDSRIPPMSSVRNARILISALLS